MKIPFVDLKSQYKAIKNEIDRAIHDVITNAAFIGGPFVQKFEEDFARYCGAEHCVGVANGTDALFIALKALGIGPGDEVIVPANSFIATSEAVTLAGAKVVFVDVDPATYNIDVRRIEDQITRKTKAIIPVHLYGQPADMDTVLDIAKRQGLKIVEDAAQAHGAVYKNRPIGSIGDAACFSFYPGKNLGAYGDAGAIVTNREDLASKARVFANHGRIDKYDHREEGVNSRLDGLQAAVLSVKLGHLDNWTHARRHNARMYNTFLEDTGVIIPEEIPDVKAVYHLYVIRVEPEKRDALQADLSAKGISTGVHYPIALPDLEAYRHMDRESGQCPNATALSREILSLPMYPELREPEIRMVADAVKSFLNDA